MAHPAKSIEECVFLLKAAVNIAERVPERFQVNGGAASPREQQNKAQRLFSDLLNPAEPRLVGVARPDYDLRDALANDALVRAVFHSREGALGVLNLGNMAFYMKATSEALTLLDIASKAFGGLSEESLKRKAVGLLGATYGGFQANERKTRELF